MNLFLYDMRESEGGPTGADSDRIGPANSRGPPPLAWILLRDHRLGPGRDDEHRLLSQVLAVLVRLPAPPGGRPQRPAAQRVPVMSIRTKVGQAKGDKADFWTAVGGQYKASLDYVVR